MDLPRVQLFEFNDASWAPKVLRDTVVEALSRALAWGRVLRGLAAPFELFLSRTHTDEVLDLAAGAAGPARILASEILRAGRIPPRFILTDLHPQPAAWGEARSSYRRASILLPKRVDALPERPAVEVTGDTDARTVRRHHQQHELGAVMGGRRRR